MASLKKGKGDTEFVIYIKKPLSCAITDSQSTLNLLIEDSFEKKITCSYYFLNCVKRNSRALGMIRELVLKYITYSYR